MYLKARTRSESFESVDKLDQTTGDGSNTWAIPANRQVIGLALRSDVKHTYGDKWANTLRISTLTVTLSDTTAPTVTATGPLTLGKWLNQAQKVCLTATADDAGAGIASIELDDQSGRALDSYNVPVQSATQPGMPSLKHDLCVVPSTLGDGVHQLKVVVRDAASETATQSLAVDVDTDAPTAKDEVPTDRTIDRRAPVSFSVDPGASRTLPVHRLGRRRADDDLGSARIAAADCRLHAGRSHRAVVCHRRCRQRRPMGSGRSP